MRTAVLERTKTWEYQEEYSFASEISKKQIEKNDKASSINRLKVFYVGGLISLVILSAMVGALNAYVTSLEIYISQVNDKIESLDESTLELKAVIDYEYGGVIQNLPEGGKSMMANNGYFVKEGWEVGG